MLSPRRNVNIKASWTNLSRELPSKLMSVAVQPEFNNDDQVCNERWPLTAAEEQETLGTNTGTVECVIRLQVCSRASLLKYAPKAASEDCDKLGINIHEFVHNTMYALTFICGTEARNCDNEPAQEPHLN